MCVLKHCLRTIPDDPLCCKNNMMKMFHWIFVKATIWRSGGLRRCRTNKWSAYAWGWRVQTKSKSENGTSNGRINSADNHLEYPFTFIILLGYVDGWCHLYIEIIITWHHLRPTPSLTMSTWIWWMNKHVERCDDISNFFFTRFARNKEWIQLKLMKMRKNRQHNLSRMKSHE